MLPLYRIREIMHPHREADPADDLRVLSSWTEYDMDTGKMPGENPLRYLCYELETRDPSTGRRYHFYKAIKFARVIRLPADARQSTAFMDKHQQVLSAVYAQEICLVAVIANVIRPVPLGLLYLYGVQGISEDIREAKRKADHDFLGFVTSMQATFRVLEMRVAKEEEAEWLREKMYSMKYMTAVRGIPKAGKTGEDAGNRGVGGKNLNPDSQGTLEEIISGLVSVEYVIEVLSSPVFTETLEGSLLELQDLMTQWNRQLQGQESLSLSLSIPMVYMANTGNSEGWSKAYTDADSVSYAEGENFSRSEGLSVGQSLGKSFGRSIGQAETSSVSNSYSEGFSHSKGVTYGQSFGESFGESQGWNRTVSGGISHGISSNASLGSSFSTNASQSAGRSEGSSFSAGETAGRSQSHLSSSSAGIGYSQNQSISRSNSASLGQSESQSINRGISENFGTGRSEGISGSESASVNYANSFNAGMNNSYSYGEGHTSGGGGNLNVGLGETARIGGTLSGTHSQSGTTSEGQSVSLGESLGYGASSSAGFSEGVSYSHGMGSSVSSGASAGRSVSLGESKGYSEGSALTQNFGVNESYGESESRGLSQGWGVTASENTSASFGNSAGFSQARSAGETWNVSQSVSDGQSYGLSHGFSYGYSQSASESSSESQTFGRTTGSSVSSSSSQSETESYGENSGRTEGISNGNSYTQSRGSSHGISNGISRMATMGTSSSMGLGPSIGYSKSYQWMDQGVKDLLEIMEYQNERLKRSLRGEGAFYTYLYIACPTREALSMAKMVTKSAWQNELAMREPLQVLELTEAEQQHLLYRFGAFSSDVTREKVHGDQPYKYCTMLLPDEFAAYTHLPRVSEGGTFSVVQDIPKFAAPAMMKGEIFMGSVLNAERFDFQTGYHTPSEYRIEEARLMHGFFTGASRSGKTVAAMRLVTELSRIKRSATGKRMRLLIMDPKQDWRGIARYVEPERFNFYSLGDPNFYPVMINPWKIPYGVWPQIWIDGIIDIYCRAYGLLERGKQMIADVVYALYTEAGVFQACDRDNWKDTVPELSAQVCFEKIYRRMMEQKLKREDPRGGYGKSGNDTADAYARLLERLSCFAREYSIERRLYGTSDGISIDELIGADDVTVLESKGLENTFKNFIFGAITSGFYKFALAHEGGFLAEDQFETVLVIEEANEVLTGSDKAGGKNALSLSGESEFEQILDQAAGYGLFIIAVTQKIADMPSSVIANSGLVFAGKLKRKEDVEVVVRTVGREEKIDDRDLVKWFPRSPTGWFVCQTSRTFDYKDAEPVLVHIAPLNLKKISNRELNALLAKKRAKLLLNA